MRAWAQRATVARDRADAELTAALDDSLDASHVFDRLIIGAGTAAIAAFASLGAPVSADGAPVSADGAPVSADGAPPVLAIAANTEQWAELPRGQVAADVELEGFPVQPADLADDPTDFVRSADLAAAVGAARAVAGLPTYRGEATRIEARPGDAPWPSGARYRVTVGARAFFAASVDVASAPGPWRVPTIGGPGSPPVAHQDGRLTDRLLVDPATGYSVDPVAGEVRDRGDRPVDPAGLDEPVRQRFGFGPDGVFRDPRFLLTGGLAAHPVTGDVFDARTGDPVDPTALDPAIRGALDDLLRRRRVQFSGENVAADYRDTDHVLVVGADASAARDVEEAARGGNLVDWVARTKPGAADAPSRVDRSPRWPVAIRLTVDSRFAVWFTDGGAGVYDRVVLSLGRDPAGPGGVVSLVGDAVLEPLTGADGEINGLYDGVGLRVLGAAATVRDLAAATARDDRKGQRPWREQADAIDAFHGDLVACAPAITAIVLGVAQEAQADAPDAAAPVIAWHQLRREVTDALAADPDADPASVLADAAHALAYTLVLEPASYTSGAQHVLDRLVSQGFESVRFVNGWVGDDERGISSAWRDPRSGRLFEVHLHTPESLAAANARGSDDADSGPVGVPPEAAEVTIAPLPSWWGGP